MRIRCAGLASAALAAALLATAESKPAWSPGERAVVDQIKTLRSLPDHERRVATQRLAHSIRHLPPSSNRVLLANALADLSTEGDLGHETVQEAATTLAAALAANPVREKDGKPGAPYIELASLMRYEHVTVALNAPQLTAALHQLEIDDTARKSAKFALADLNGHRWSLTDLRGKVVLVNFWATWCPPCRREMSDMQRLYSHFKKRGFVVLAISDEDTSRVAPFVREQGITYPVLLDPDRRVNEAYRIDGIPKSFLYNRDGKIVAQSIDMCTRDQFLVMLSKAGLQE
jgi:peroxiredoxin